MKRPPHRMTQQEKTELSEILDRMAGGMGRVFPKEKLISAEICEFPVTAKNNEQDSFEKAVGAKYLNF